MFQSQMPHNDHNQESVPRTGKSLCSSVLKAEETLKHSEGNKAGQRTCKQLFLNYEADEEHHVHFSINKVKKKKKTFSKVQGLTYLANLVRKAMTYFL